MEVTHPRSWIRAAWLVAVSIALSAVAAATNVDSPAPDFTLQTRNGEPVSLSDLRGQVVMINFWATWCGPQRDAPARCALPALQPPRI